MLVRMCRCVLGPYVSLLNSCIPLNGFAIHIPLATLPFPPNPSNTTNTTPSANTKVSFTSRFFSHKKYQPIASSIMLFVSFFLFIYLLAGFACATLHPAYTDLQTESEDRCGWCVELIEPAIKRAVINSSPSDNTLNSITAALNEVVTMSELHDEFEMIREEVEMTRWDTARMRRISALQRFYHSHPSYRSYFDRLIDHVICACRPLEVGEHERAMSRALELHALAVRKEYRAHGYPDGMAPAPRGRGSISSTIDEL